MLKYKAARHEYLTQWGVYVEYDKDLSDEILYGFSERDAREIAAELNMAFNSGSRCGQTSCEGDIEKAIRQSTPIPGGYI